MATKLFSVKIFCITSLLILLGCSTSQKQRMEQRDKVSAASGLYCEFLSGDMHNDIDVELVLQMGKRCDANKPYSITNYKTSSENYGVIYCCSIKQEEKPHDSEALDEDDAEIKDHKNGPKDPNKDPLKDKLNKDGKMDPHNNLKPNDANKPGAPGAQKPGTLQNPAKPGASNPGGSAAKPSGSGPGGSSGSSSAPKPGGSSPSSPSGSSPSGGSPSTGSPNAPSTSTPSSSPSSPSASSPAKPSTPPSKPAPPKPPGPKAPQFNDADILGD